MTAPPRMKNPTINSAGTTPKKMYERISLRRTRQSSLRLVRTIRRHRKYESEITRPTVAATLSTRATPGSTSTARSSPTTILIAADARKMRPGQEWKRRYRADGIGVAFGGKAGAVRSLPRRLAMRVENRMITDYGTGP